MFKGRLYSLTSVLLYVVSLSSLCSLTCSLLASPRYSVCVNGRPRPELGGDEFVVCMTDLGKTVEEAKAIAKERAELLLQSFQQPFDVQGLAMKLGASLGVTFFNNHKISASELLGHADMAMYKAKEAGKNQVMYFEESMAESVARMTELKEDSRE